MLSFRRLTISDMPMLRRCFERSGSRLCDATVGGIIFWRDIFDISCATVGDTPVFMQSYYKEPVSFAFPAGDDPDGALDAVAAHCKESGMPCIFSTVGAQDLERLRSRFEIISCEANRDYADYLYNARDITTLTGKKYSGQRNHINRFRSLYEYSFRRMDSVNLADARALFDALSVYDADLPPSGADERLAELAAFDCFDTEYFCGGIIYVNNAPVAFSIGEKLGDTLHVHIERADVSYRGSYQIMVHEFSNAFADDGIAYINRQEDTGDEGLRTSKLSYHPTALLDKYTVQVKL